MKRLFRVALATLMAVALGLALVACGPSQETKDAIGMYTLSEVSVGTTTYDEAKIAELEAATGDTSLSSLFLELKEEGKFSMSLPNLDNVEGDYKVNGDEITLTAGLLGGSVVATYVDGSISITMDGTTVVYKR